jgi:hypothetical protein
MVPGVVQCVPLCRNASRKDVWAGGAGGKPDVRAPPPAVRVRSNPHWSHAPWRRSATGRLLRVDHETFHGTARKQVTISCGCASRWSMSRRLTVPARTRHMMTNGHCGGADETAHRRTRTPVGAYLGTPQPADRLSRRCGFQPGCRRSRTRCHRLRRLRRPSRRRCRRRPRRRTCHRRRRSRRCGRCPGHRG